MSHSDAQDFPTQRSRMVAEVDATYDETRRETGLAAMSQAVRKAMGKVERHRLVPREQQSAAYQNRPLPIGNGQTISHPYIVPPSPALLPPNPHHTLLQAATAPA